MDVATSASRARAAQRAVQEPTTTICLLGGPHVEVDGARIEIQEGSGPVLALVALRDGEVDRREAAGILWPNCDDLRAAGNLRSALWRLRGAGLDIIEANRRRLALRAGTLVDVAAVREWARRLIEGSAVDADLSTRDLRARMTELLPGWYDDWVITERERLRQEVLHGVEALARHLLLRRRHAQAIEAALATVGADPFRESAVRVLIEAHLAEGNVNEARRTFSRHEQLVGTELGVEPSGELRSLVVRWVAHPPICDWCPARLRARSG